eukprot:gnl/TRDRNA2_/TRDRNA2_75551_c0_seq1.p1 gnl/TRDRNA2_/TRDRNA2_75551_c0~~gnl/TRDRNA2_/TRDRNA2_75551_c0_seq1.p1  ORF type:complete len:350 (+),score=48.74 gnl/TRDRNA2_/TRDRNA2_75551_c0_seq1:94-1143(+)
MCAAAEGPADQSNASLRVRRWGHRNPGADAACPQAETTDVVIGNSDQLLPERLARWGRRSVAQRPADYLLSKEGGEVEEEHLGTSLSFGDDVKCPDAIRVLLDRRTEDIVVKTRDSDSCRRGGDVAAQAAMTGLFPRSRLASPWQLILEEGLARDCEGAVLGGGAHHLRGALCEATDLRLFEALRDELCRGDSAWSRGTTGKARRKWSIPGKNGRSLSAGVEDLRGEALPAFASVLHALCARFDAECLTWWANLYEDGKADRSFHHDCSASERGRNITIGGSFGAARSLTFRHCGDRSRTFHFPQWNGDIFAFREAVNSAFEHGVFPTNEDVGPRISVVIMGRVADQRQ